MTPLPASAEEKTREQEEYAENDGQDAHQTTARCRSIRARIGPISPFR